MLPEYKVVDLDDNFSWVRYTNGSYVVDFRHEQEFIDIFCPPNRDLS